MWASENKECNQYNIGIDLGTTHIKLAVFDDQGTMVRLLKELTPVTDDDFGRIYDPLRLYGIIKEKLLLLFEQYQGIRGIAITGMSEAGVMLDRKSGIELSPAVPWFDQRTADLADRVTKEEETDNFYKTGLHNSFKYGIYKYLWLLSQSNIKKEDTIWLSVCDYIGYKLTGRYTTDPSFAARTYVYDINSRGWDTQRLERYGLTHLNFPTVLPSGELSGYLSVSELRMKSRNTPVMVCIGGHDHVCAAYAVLDQDTDRICDSVGTAETYLGIDKNFSLSEERYHSGMVYGPFLNEKDYFWMANISSSGQSVEWFCSKAQNEPIDYMRMNQLLQSAPEGPTGLLYFPFLSGIGTPLFRSDIGGGFLGLRETHGTADLLKAIVEGIQYQSLWLLSLIPGIDINEIRDVICVGGAANSSPWMKIKADVLGLPVTVPEIAEASLAGAVAVMIDKHYGSEEKRRFLSGSKKRKQVYEADQRISNRYREIYRNKYKFLIDKILE